MKLGCLSTWITDYVFEVMNEVLVGLGISVDVLKAELLFYFVKNASFIKIRFSLALHQRD